MRLETHLRNGGDGVTRTLDLASLAAVLGSLSQLLPPIASLLTIVWLGLRIWESETVRRLLRRPAAEACRREPEEE